MDILASKSRFLVARCLGAKFCGEEAGDVLGSNLTQEQDAA